MKLIKPFLNYRGIKVYKFLKSLDFPKIVLNRKTEALVTLAQKGLRVYACPSPSAATWGAWPSEGQNPGTWAIPGRLPCVE